MIDAADVIHSTISFESVLSICCILILYIKGLKCMDNKCINYKFILILLFPLSGIFTGTFMILYSEKIYILPFMFLSISIILLITLIIFEPVCYLICEDGIKVQFVFRNYYFEWKNIKYIEVHYDSHFSNLFIKDYCLVTSDNHIATYKRNIMKYKKTTKLIKRFGPNKIVD